MSAYHYSRPRTATNVTAGGRAPAWLLRARLRFWWSRNWDRVALVAAAGIAAAFAVWLP